MDPMERAGELLPSEYRKALSRFPVAAVEEIRLRLGQDPVILSGDREERFFSARVSEKEIRAVLEKATGASLHTAAPALAEGYLNYRGLRIGVCGRAVIKGGGFGGFREVNALAIRLPRQIKGICDELVPQLSARGFQSTLVLAPPGGGKTTALRELIRALSEQGCRVCVVDERNELAALDQSGFQFDLGAHTDVLTGVPKAEGAMMLLRGMNPQILAMDEISREQDAEAVMHLSGCAVGILASAHASDMDDLRRRPLYRKLLEADVFRYCIVIRRSGSRRSYHLREAKL